MERSGLNSAAVLHDCMRNNNDNDVIMIIGGGGTRSIRQRRRRTRGAPLEQTYSDGRIDFGGDSQFGGGLLYIGNSTAKLD